MNTNVMVYGKEPPKLSFVQSPDGAITFKIENKNKVNTNFSNEKGILRWVDMIWNSYYMGILDALTADDKLDAPFLMWGQDLEDVGQFHQLLDHLASMVGSATEETFLRTYAAMCLAEARVLDGYSFMVWAKPALVPQAWVNWIHYDSADSQRAKRAREEPFRVDFMIKDRRMGPNFTVIEIDGISHFGDIKSHNGDTVRFEASMNAYTEHLRKDRWLRKHGWNVFRISNQEVEDFEENYPYNGEYARLNSFALFWEDVFGPQYYIDVPF